MLSRERSDVCVLKRVGLSTGRARRDVTNCLLRAEFSCSRFRIKFSCSMFLCLAEDPWRLEAELIDLGRNMRETHLLHLGLPAKNPQNHYL